MIHAYDELQLEKKNPVVSVVKLNSTVAYIRYKKHYYQELLNTHSQDLCNPATMHVQEPDITPEHKSTLRTNQRKKR